MRALLMSRTRQASGLSLTTKTVHLDPPSSSVFYVNRSAMFNVLVIVALSAAVAAKSGASGLIDHRVVARDVCFYTCSILLLVSSARDDKIEWFEVRVSCLVSGPFPSEQKLPVGSFGNGHRQRDGEKKNAAMMDGRHTAIRIPKRLVILRNRTDYVVVLLHAQSTSPFTRLTLARSLRFSFRQTTAPPSFPVCDRYRATLTRDLTIAVFPHFIGPRHGVGIRVVHRLYDLQLQDSRHVLRS